MSFRSMPSLQYCGGGFNKVGLFYYDGGSRYRSIYSLSVALVCRPSLAGFAGFWGIWEIFPHTQYPLLYILIFGG